MLLTAAVHMDSSSTSQPPWRPVLTVAGHHHNQLLHDFTPATSASSTATPPQPATTPSNQQQRHPLLRAAARRVTRRRPRPSHRLPTTYISADPASFRRMVHQVTGGDDLPPLPQQPNNAEILARPAPVRAHDGGGSFTGRPGGGVLLPTLDTSASFLVDALISRRTGTTDATRPSWDGPTAAPALDVETRACNNSNTGAGFPTLESWDHDALF